MFNMSKGQAQFLGVCIVIGAITLAIGAVSAIGGVLFLLYRGIMSLIGG